MVHYYYTSFSTTYDIFLSEVGGRIGVSVAVWLRLAGCVISGFLPTIPKELIWGDFLNFIREL